MLPDKSGWRRIGVIVPGFSADQGDWCIPALRNLVRELARSHDVQVFAIRYPHHRGRYPVDGAVVHAVGGGMARGISRVRLLARAHASIMAVHRERPFALLHAFWADEPGFLAVSTGRRLGVPAIVSLMGGELARLQEIGYGGQLPGANRWLTRYALREAACVTVGSEYLGRMNTERTGGVAAERVPLGVDSALFSPGGVGEHDPLGKDSPKLLAVASLLPVKDHATLFRALALMKVDAMVATPPHLHLVGDGPIRGDLEALATTLGVADRVTFHGAISHEKLPAYYRAADLCVLSSRHESQSLVVLEAAACGTGTIGTAVGILPELGDAVRVVPVGDPRALAEAIAAVIRDPGQVATMGRLARAAVVEHYTIERTVGQLETLYSEAVGLGGRVAGLPR